MKDINMYREKINYIEELASLFMYKTITDENKNEYVILESDSSESIERVEDKTAFEALINHVHLVSNIKKAEFKRLLKIANKIGKAVLINLNHYYPDKQFVVYVSMCVGDDMIVRFHQKWPGEDVYYHPEDFNSSVEKVLMFET